MLDDLNPSIFSACVGLTFENIRYLVCMENRTRYRAYMCTLALSELPVNRHLPYVGIVGNAGFP